MDIASLDPTTATTTSTFQSVRSTNVNPSTIAFQKLNPLKGTFLLTSSEYTEFNQGQTYGIFFIQDDETAYGRMRGSIAQAATPSVIGGLVFEYTDEWLFLPLAKH